MPATTSPTSPRRRAQKGIDPSDLDGLGRFGVERMVAAIQATLARFGVEHDRYSSERELRESGRVQEVLEALDSAGATYESEGAVWLRSSDYGDDKDRVLLRTGGEPTYLAPDIAYHRDKLSRADVLIDVLGADHHGYLQRMRAAIAALGEPPERLEALLMQLVQIVERGQRTQMSKRRGDFVTLDELVDDIGVDAARWYMLQRSHDTAIDLDLDLARSQSSENPVYYVQYAHARIASILRKAADEGVDTGPAGGPACRARRAIRARPDQAAARAPGRGDRGGRAPRSAPPLRLRDDDRGRLPRLLPRLPGRRRGGGGRPGGAPRPLPGDQGLDRPGARPARDQRSRADVDRVRPH